MSEVQRYSIEGSGERVVMAPYQHGDWVRYEDHWRAVEEAVAAEREACAQAVEALRDSYFIEDSTNWHRFTDAGDGIRGRGQA